MRLVKFYTFLFMVALTASGFTAETDCLLEERRFELSVPP